MEYETTFRNLNGSWYALIPKGFTEHMKLKEEEGLVEGMIRTEFNNKKQPYCAIWKKGTQGEPCSLTSAGDAAPTNAGCKSQKKQHTAAAKNVATNGPNQKGEKMEEWERWFAYFDTLKSKFRAAIQDENYIEERSEFIRNTTKYYLKKTNQEKKLENLIYNNELEIKSAKQKLEKNK